MSDTTRHNKNSESGNTKETRRSRNWFFTLNNYTEDDIKHLEDIDAEYVFQKEKGENGTPHLQGIIMYANPRTLKSMKKINRRIHWEPSRDKKASIKYCIKDDTRDGEIYTNIDISIYKDRVKKNPEVLKRSKFILEDDLKIALMGSIEEWNRAMEQVELWEKFDKYTWDSMINH